MEFDLCLPYLLVPIPHCHMAHLLPQKAQYLRCLPETQPQLIKHKPQSYLPEGDAVLSYNPLGLEEVPQFPETQPGFFSHGPSPQKVCPKGEPPFFNRAVWSQVEMKVFSEG